MLAKAAAFLTLLGCATIAGAQIVDTGSETGIAAKVSAPLPEAKSAVPASSPEEERSRHLLQLKAERAAASQHAAGDPRLTEIDAQIAAIQRDLAAATSSSPVLFVDSAGSQPMPAQLYPRIVPVTVQPVEPPADLPRRTSALSSTAPAAPIGAVSADALANRETLAAFEARVSLAADAQSLAAVLEDLRKQTHGNLFINWAALQTAGIDRNTPVSLHLANVSAARALRAILDHVGGNGTNLHYTIDDGILTVSTRDDLSSVKYQIVRVYNVRDLLAPTSQFPAQIATLLQGQLSMALTDTIKSIVQPDSWRDNGGAVGSIREFNGMLIINQTADNQAAVERLLNQFRGAR